MKVTERRAWAVAEFTIDELRLIESDLSEKEALERASHFNKVGDYSYVAVPVVITNRHYGPGEFDLFYKGLQRRLG